MFAHPQDDADFMAGRLCAGRSPEFISHVFFPGRGERYDEAARVCGACHVREKCLRYFIGVEDGYVAGTTPEERKALRRKKAS